MASVTGLVVGYEFIRYVYPINDKLDFIVKGLTSGLEAAMYGEDFENLIESICTPEKAGSILSDCACFILNSEK